MKGRFFQFVAVAFISANVALAAAAMPKWIGDRIVDKIMDWGDRHVHGPFTKGGGDEAVTREVVSSAVMPGNAWKTAINLTFKNESQTASLEQDSPGYSQQHGVPMPQGAHVQIPIGQPAATQTPTQPTVTVNKEIHPKMLSDLLSDDDFGPEVEQALKHPVSASPTKEDREQASRQAVSGPSAAVNDAPVAHNDTAPTTSQAPSAQKWLRAGETTNVQVNTETVYHPNPEAATGGNSAQPTPTATPAPASPSASSDRTSTDAMKSMIEGRVGPSLPSSVGVSPVERSRDVDSHGNTGGGGHSEPPGTHVGPDGPGHVARDTA
jgi:hypothetical protein